MRAGAEGTALAQTWGLNGREESLRVSAWNGLWADDLARLWELKAVDGGVVGNADRANLTAVPMQQAERCRCLVHFRGQIHGGVKPNAQPPHCSHRPTLPDPGIDNVTAPAADFGTERDDGAQL